MPFTQSISGLTLLPDEHQHVEGMVELVPAPPPEDPRVVRRRGLEARFCELFTEKARHEDAAKTLHDELMRIQGALGELDRLSANVEKVGGG